MGKREIDILLKGAEYRFAKSIPKYPHWYSLRLDWENDNEFIEVVNFIRDVGEKRMWWWKEYIYYYLDGYKYWTMGADIKDTTLINKAKI